MIFAFGESDEAVEYDYDTRLNSDVKIFKTQNNIAPRITISDSVGRSSYVDFRPTRSTMS